MCLKRQVDLVSSILTFSQNGALRSGMPSSKSTGVFAGENGQIVLLLGDELWLNYNKNMNTGPIFPVCLLLLLGTLLNGRASFLEELELVDSF